jgi:hypothetical protein
VVLADAGVGVQDAGNLAEDDNIQFGRTPTSRLFLPTELRIQYEGKEDKLFGPQGCLCNMYIASHFSPRYISNKLRTDKCIYKSNF